MLTIRYMADYWIYKTKSYSIWIYYCLFLNYILPVGYEFSKEYKSFVYKITQNPSWSMLNICTSSQWKMCALHMWHELLYQKYVYIKLEGSQIRFKCYFFFSAKYTIHNY